MLNPHLPSLAAGEAERVAAETAAGIAAPGLPAAAKSPRPPRPPAICFLGFRATADGREYSLRVTGESEPRHFLLFIGHEVFASRQLSFQDAPDFCFARMQSDLSANPDLLPGPRRALTAEDFLEYHRSRQSPAAARRRRRSDGVDRGSPGGLIESAARGGGRRARRQIPTGDPPCSDATARSSPSPPPSR